MCCAEDVDDVDVASSFWPPLGNVYDSGLSLYKFCRHAYKSAAVADNHHRQITLKNNVDINDRSSLSLATLFSGTDIAVDAVKAGVAISCLPVCSRPCLFSLTGVISVVAEVLRARCMLIPMVRAKCHHVKACG
jgi:hypothetical protein